jgi:hypothetical protein
MLLHHVEMFYCKELLDQGALTLSFALSGMSKQVLKMASATFFQCA